MKKICVRQVVIIVMVMMLASVFSTSVFAEEATGEMGVAYRGHVQNKGNVPQLDNSYIDGPTELGTRGESLRIEGFQFKLTGTVPAGMQIRYNVHVQDKGWLYNLEDPASWAKDGEFAGTRGECLRIEAIKIVLLDANGDDSNGYSVLYRGHVQNVGNLPAADDDWLQDGAQLGTTGSGQRLEAVQVKILKTDSSPELEAYQALIAAIASLTEKDYTPNTWADLQTAMINNTVTFEGNTIKEIKAATAAIQSADDKLVKKEPAVVYDTAGTYGPASGTEEINGDVIVKADGVTLRNLHINGDLFIGEEQAAEATEGIAVDTISDGQISTEAVDQTSPYQTHCTNSEVEGTLRPYSGGTITIATPQPQQFSFSLSDGTQFTAATQGGGDGQPGSFMGITTGSSGSGTLTFGGSLNDLTLLTSGTKATLSSGCRVQHLTVSPTARISLIIMEWLSSINAALIEGSGATFTGQGTLIQAYILANHVSFERRPDGFEVGPGVTEWPSMPALPVPTPTQSQPIFSTTGAVAFPTTVIISAQGADAIYYTTDGSDPQTVSGVQSTTKITGNTGEIAISSNVTVKAIATRTGYNASAITSAAYTQAKADLDGLELSGNPSNYFFSGGTYDYPGVTVANDVATITLRPSGGDWVTIQNSHVFFGFESDPIPLTAGGETLITVHVDKIGKLSQDYTIKVTRAN